MHGNSIICRTCKSEKPASPEYFAKDSKAKCGFKSQCKECDKVYRKNHYAQNHESIRKSQNKYLKQYYRKNKNAILDYKHHYYEENKESILAKEHKYQKQNREKINKYRRGYKQSNPDLFTKYRHKRKAAEQGLPNTYTEKEWEVAKAAFSYCCAYCGMDIELTQDHFIPVSKGGGYISNNIIPACIHCNSSKCNLDFLDWYLGYEYYSPKRERQIFEYLGIETGGFNEESCP